MQSFKSKYYLETIIKYILILLGITILITFFKIVSNELLIEIGIYIHIAVVTQFIGLVVRERQNLENSEFTKIDFAKTMVILSVICIIGCMTVSALLFDLNIIIGLLTGAISIVAAIVNIVMFKKHKTSHYKYTKLEHNNNYKIENKLQSFVHYPTIITAIVLLLTNNNLKLLPIIIILVGSYILSITTIFLISNFTKRYSND